MHPDDPTQPQDTQASAPATETGNSAIADVAPNDATPHSVDPTDASPVDATPTAAQEAAAGDDDGEGDEEGAAAEGEQKAEGAPGQKKKRRRRRKKKPGAEGGAPKPEGEAAAEGAEGAEGEAAAEGAEGEGKKREKPRRPQRDKPPFGIGEEVVGKVTSILPDALMLDVAGKALGIFDRKEIPESETPAVGEQIIGKVSNDGARGGCVVLTKDLNRWQTSRLIVEAAFNEKKQVDGLITGVIKGGIEVDVDGLRGFAPASHVDLRLGADLHYMIGQRVPFDVVQFAKRGREFVLSRKSMLEAGAKENRQKALENVKVGEIVKGTVRSVQPFGAFIDVGGIDGLCTPVEASHDGKPLNQVFKVGEEVDVKILRVDENGKIWLSRRAAEHDPWVGVAEKYAKGTIHKGKVVRLQPFGAFIELEPGIDGLLHVSDIFAPRRIAHPNEVLKVGEDIDVIVFRLELDQRRIALHEAPKGGEQAAGMQRGRREGGRLGPHSHVKAVVEAHEPSGLVVRIVGQTGKQAKGFIPAVATGTPKGTELRKAFPVGTEIDAKVVEFDPRKPLRLSIKALAQDQERQSFRQYQNEVKQASKFGTFGDLLKNKGITK